MKQLLYNAKKARTEKYSLQAMFIQRDSPALLATADLYGN